MTSYSFKKKRGPRELQREGHMKMQAESIFSYPTQLSAAAAPVWAVSPALPPRHGDAKTPLGEANISAPPSPPLLARI